MQIKLRINVRPQRTWSVLVRGMLALSAAAVVSSPMAQTYITPSTPGWAFVEEAPTGAGAFVNGPGTPPSGSPGSVQLTVGNPGGELFYT